MTTTTARRSIARNEGSRRALSTKSGASIAITERDGRERIEVRDADARVLVDFDPATGKMTLSAPGDIALAAGGDLDLAAKGAVRVRGGDRVELEAGSGVNKSSLSVGGAIAKLSARVLAVSAEETRFVGAAVRARLDDARVEVGRLERVAETVIERAKNVFRDVEDLCQLKAGRARTIVDGGWFVRSHHGSLEAQDDLRIDGKSINLG